MNIILSWKMLIPLGLLMFFVGGGIYGDIGIIGLFCFVYGLLEVLFHKQISRLNVFLKTRGNYVSFVLLFLVLFIIIFYIIRNNF